MPQIIFSGFVSRARADGPSLSLTSSAPLPNLSFFRLHDERRRRNGAYHTITTEIDEGDKTIQYTLWYLMITNTIRALRIRRPSTARCPNPLPSTDDAAVARDARDMIRVRRRMRRRVVVVVLHRHPSSHSSHSSRRRCYSCASTSRIRRRRRRRRRRISRYSSTHSRTRPIS